MEILIDKKTFKSVICLKDHKAYVYDIDRNPYFLLEDYALIKCFPVKSDAKPDFSNEIEIYGKYLISVD